MLSGVDVVKPPKRPTYGLERNQGFGAGIGLIGVILAIFGVIWRRRDPGWILLGGGLFLGNLAFYFWHHCWDGLTFTVPGLAGLALLAGIGAAGPNGARHELVWRRICLAAGVAMSLALLATNYRLVDRRSGDDERLIQKIADDFKSLPWPRDCAVLSNYWEATHYRYLLHLEAGRTDVHLLDSGVSSAPQIAKALRQRGAAIFLSPRFSERIDQNMRRAAAAQTPQAFKKQGILMLYAGDAPRR
jgi:hypothetical protein